MTERERERRSACWEGDRERGRAAAAATATATRTFHTRAGAGRSFGWGKLRSRTRCAALRWASGESLPFEIPGRIGLLLSFSAPSGFLTPPERPTLYPIVPGPPGNRSQSHTLGGCLLGRGSSFWGQWGQFHVRKAWSFCCVFCLAYKVERGVK